MPNAFTEIFEGFARSQEALRKATTWVEWEHDPETPGRTAYRISGPSKEAVQAAIDNRHRTIERLGGRAEFLNPVLNGDGKWWSCGYMIRANAEASA